jgi:ParB-like chromosome segregation protein Spo0J
VRIGKATFRLAFSGEIPTPSADDHKRLRASIKKHKKVLVPIIVDGPGNVIDGEARLLIAAEEGLPPGAVPIRLEHTSSVEESREMCRDINLARRHLTREQLRRVIDGELKEDPGQSNRKLAAKVGAHKNTVQSERERLEAGGEIAQLEKRTGRDGKARRKPRSGKKKADPPATKDKLGNPIPEPLRDAFNDPALPRAVEWLQSLLPQLATDHHVRALMARLGALAFLDLGGVERHWREGIYNLELALERLLAGAPEVVCRACVGMGCVNCRRSGHMPLWQHRDLVDQGVV